MKSVRLAALALTPLLALPAFSRAQAQSESFVYTYVTTVKPSNVQDLEDYVKKLIAAMNKVGAPQRLFTFQLQAGGPGFTYMSSIPFGSLEEMDAWPSVPEIITKAYGDVEGAKILKAGRAAIEKQETRVSRTLNELSTNAKPFDPAATPVVRLILTEVDPAMTGAYEQYLAKVRSAQEKAPSFPTVGRRVAVFGTAGFYSSATYLRSVGDLARLPSQADLMRNAFGEDGGRTISESGNRAVRNRETWLMRYRSDLSRPTVSSTTN